MSTPFPMPDLVRLPAGEFMMGESADDKFANDTERPAHQVCLAQDIAVGRYPVTVDEFCAFRPEHAEGDAPMLPAVNVTWHDAVAYTQWLSHETGHKFRLLSEAEWEYACRAGSGTPFACGSEINTVYANFLYHENGRRIGLGHRTSVGSYPANGFGLYDLHGNVCEWVADVWHQSYEAAPADGSAWMNGGEPAQRVVRGGAWDYLPRLLRSSWRDHLPAFAQRDNLGFRIATNDLTPHIP